MSGEGIHSLSENLRSIENLSVPTMPKKVIQMLGLTSYYHKFILAYTDLIRTLTHLTCKTVLFIWTSLMAESV